MEKAIGILMSEHRIIESVISALHIWVDSVITHKSDDREHLQRFVRVISEFADGWHHGKEEDILFKTMSSNGFSDHFGPILVMLEEHRVGREYLGQMRQAATLNRPWTDADRAAVADAALGYVDLMTHHIQKEDNILYPMALSRLPTDAQTSVDKAFDTFEHAAGRDEQRARLHALVVEVGGVV